MSVSKRWTENPRSIRTNGSKYRDVLLLWRCISVFPLHFYLFLEPMMVHLIYWATFGFLRIVFFVIMYILYIHMYIFCIQSLILLCYKTMMLFKVKFAIHLNILYISERTISSLISYHEEHIYRKKMVIYIIIDAYFISHTKIYLGYFILILSL